MPDHRFMRPIVETRSQEQNRNKKSRNLFYGWPFHSLIHRARVLPSDIQSEASGSRYSGLIRTMLNATPRSQLSLPKKDELLILL